MNENTTGRKTLSLVLLILGLVLLAAALWMDITKTYVVVDLGTKIALRGLFLVLGALLILAGLYYIPTVMHHRTIINIIFLFPLLFTFAVTVTSFSANDDDTILSCIDRSLFITSCCSMVSMPT